MSEKQPNEQIFFSHFADWCRHIDSLSEDARHTVKELLKQAGTDDAQEAERILSGMTQLALCSNRITDISVLGSLTNLTTLHLNSNKITDISVLGSLTILTTLHLDRNRITDISVLGSLTNLTTLDLDRNRITDISFLGSLTNLTTLHLDSNRITDISFLGSLTNLITLHLDSNRITDISFLGSLTNLTTLDLGRNQITDISFLASLTNLRTLDLNINKITDISALGSLTNLTELHLWGNQITALWVLGELPQKRLTLWTRPIDGQKATEAVKVAYATISLEEPEVIICSSPRDAYLQIFNLLKHDYSQNCSNEGHWNRLWKKLDWKTIFQSIVRQFASPAVWKYELSCMTLEPEADSALSSLINEVFDELERSERMNGNVFPAHLLYLKYPETPTTLFKEIYLTQWYISSLGVNISQKAQEILRCQKLLFEHCGLIFPFEKFCAVCDRPATCALTVKTACTRKENLRSSLQTDGIFTIITASDCLKNTANSTQINGNPNGF